jgi:cytoskeletal protein RodZ
MREIGLREISEASKISLRYLEAFEQDRLDVLPAPVFARGFLREYARYVGLNPDEVVNYFLSTLPAAAGPASAPLAGAGGGGQGRRRDWLYGFVLAGGTAALLGIVALLAYVAETRQEALVSAPPPIAPPPLVAIPPPAPAPAEPPAPLRVSLEFLQDCWVERVVDGATRVSELRVRGETLQIEAQESVVLTFGNAPGVRLKVNGEERPLPPADGTIVRDFRIESIEPVAPGVESLAGPG